jgi:hypothetical protein
MSIIMHTWLYIESDVIVVFVVVYCFNTVYNHIRKRPKELLYDLSCKCYIYAVIKYLQGKVFRCTLQIFF